MPETITATIVCIGRFHHFELAKELEHRRMLDHIFTGYPRWKLTGTNIHPDRIRTFPWLQTPYMGMVRWSGFIESRLGQNWAWIAQETLDRHVAEHHADSAIMFALSGSGLTCGRLAQARGSKFVCDRGSAHIQVQNEILSEEYSRWGERFPGIDQRMIEKEEAEYEIADCITVPSGFAYRSFLSRGISKDKLHIIPYGVDLHRFKQVGMPDSNTFKVLFVGRVSFQKGFPDLMTAFGMLKHPKKCLQVVGGISPEIARYLKRYPHDPSIEFLGHLPRIQLTSLMSNSHVLVLPSIQDGFGLVLTQALACGCPVIATVHTGAADIIKDRQEGFIVPIRDPKAIAEKMQLLADDKNIRSAMSHKALDRIRYIGGWSDYGNKIVDLFSQIVKSKMTDDESKGRSLSDLQ